MFDLFVKVDNFYKGIDHKMSELFLKVHIQYPGRWHQLRSVGPLKSTIADKLFGKECYSASSLLFIESINKEHVAIFLHEFCERGPAFFGGEPHMVILEDEVIRGSVEYNSVLPNYLDIEETCADQGIKYILAKVKIKTPMKTRTIEL